MSDRPLVVEAESVVTPDGVTAHGAVQIAYGRIGSVDRAGALPAGVERLTGTILMPGFIDLHLHGFGGHDFHDGPVAALAAVRDVARTGVTSCYAGLGAGPAIEAIARTVAGVAEAVGRDSGGARIAGIFLEGPFINPERSGAWNPANLRRPSVRDLHELIAASSGRIDRVNVAPELPGAIAFIQAARAAGVVVSVGHSNATYEDAIRAVEAGATITNHTYNAMSPLDHRAPGLVGATFTCDRLLGELILDGVHVHPAAARALLRAKGAGGVSLISDGSPFTGVSHGTYRFDGREVIVEDGRCRLPDGTLVAGLAPFDKLVRNAAAWLGAGLVELAALSSGNAARAMGIDSHTGAIVPGKDADLVLLDEELRVLATIVGGRVVYRREEVT